ncbi:MAG: ATP-dependent Clp protease adaptor ClpS [Bacteroidota bacterium]
MTKIDFHLSPELEEEIAVEEQTDKHKSIVLHNDNYNTFDWVIESLMDVCDHHPEQATQCSYIVHYKGKCSVKEGAYDKLKPMKDALIDRGLNATIE